METERTAKQPSPTQAVVGVGPVGSILAAHLLHAGFEVALVDIPARIDQIRAKGLPVHGHSEFQAWPRHVHTSIGDLAQYSLENLFIAVKTPLLKVIMEDIRTVFRSGMRVICFQNGIGPEDYVSGYVGADSVLRAVVNYAGSIGEDGAVKMDWFHPPNFLGPASERDKLSVQPMVELLNAAGLASEVVSHHEICKQVFFKTILNSALNALCAISGITMYEAMKYRHTRSLAKLLIREGLYVAKSCGYTYGEDAEENCVKYLDRGGHHYPSMWMDLKNKRPTEIEFINGKIVEAAQSLDIDVSLNVFFISLVITEEIKNGTRDPRDIPRYLIV